MAIIIVIVIIVTVTVRVIRLINIIFMEISLIIQTIIMIITWFQVDLRDGKLTV